MIQTQPPFAPLRRRPAFLLLATTLFLAGCGLSDYERQMASEQERLEAFDKDAKYLNGYIDMPRVERLVEDKMALKQEKALVLAWEGVNLFLRVPLGINTKPDEKDNPVAGTFNTFRYSSKSNGSFRELRVAAATSDSKDFDKDLAQQGWNENFASQLAVRKPYGREPLSFRTYEVPAPDGSTFFFHIYVPDAVRKKQGGDVRLAVIFVVPKGKVSPSTKEQMDACLSAVGIGAEATRLKGEYDFQLSHKVQAPATPGIPAK